MPEGAEEFSWSVTTHQHREHSVDWYWTLGVVAVVAAVACIFFGDILLGVIIAIAALCIGVLTARGPRTHSVAVHRNGISMDGTLYPFSSIHSFWIETELEEPRLYISTTGFLAPHFALRLPEEIDLPRLHQFLKHFVAEEEQSSHIGEHVAELFGL